MQEMNIGAFLTKRASLSPKKEALVLGDVRLTWDALNKRSNQLAAAMAGLGVGAGDRVALLALNEVEFFDMYFGLGKTGAILVPINHRLAGPEIEYIVDDCQAKVLVFGAEFAPVIASIRERISCAHIVALSDDPPAYAQSYKALTDGASDAEPEITAGGADILTILYTSGTTGRPKGAELTHDGYFGTSVTLRATFGDIGQVLLMPLPLFHIGGLAPVPMCVHFGMKMVIQRAFDPKNFLELMGREKVTWFGSVPQILMFLRQVPDFDKYGWDTVKMALVYAAPVPVPLIKEYAAAGIEVRQLYGMTECTGPATVIDSENAIEKAGSCGLPFFHNQIRVVDLDGNDAGPDEPGEVLIGGTNLMKGYWNNPEATAETIKDGWLYSGDMAKMDKDGFLYIIDRKKDMIISGGENIYPAEIEDLLMGHPKIADVGVIGCPDEKWGESIKAIVVARQGESIDDAEVIQWCQGRIAKFKIPRKVVITEEIPRTPTGKILKRVLRDQFNSA
ncbi:MAG: long-chain-fatty-acid--CoA ligase [Desulfosalsimonas sp.]|uniref:long-chain-fatty-acid--CoA ligase n=1 Tax=Desulfosalsimonas sp. TaxID=3073848 RepID=UPI003970DE7A